MERFTTDGVLKIDIPCLYDSCDFLPLSFAGNLLVKTHFCNNFHPVDCHGYTLLALLFAISVYLEGMKVKKTSLPSLTFQFLFCHCLEKERMGMEQYVYDETFLQINGFYMIHLVRINWRNTWDFLRFPPSLPKAMSMVKADALGPLEMCDR